MYATQFQPMQQQQPQQQQQPMFQGFQQQSAPWGMNQAFQNQGQMRHDAGHDGPRRTGLCFECGGAWPCRKDPSVCAKGRPFQVRQHRSNPQREKRLEHVKTWSKQVLCCFQLLGTCKYKDDCMYSHVDTGNNPCHFGLACKHGHEARKNEPQKEVGEDDIEKAAEAAAATATEDAPKDEEKVEAKEESKEEESGKKEEEKTE